MRKALNYTSQSKKAKGDVRPAVEDSTLAEGTVADHKAAGHNPVGEGHHTACPAAFGSPVDLVGGNPEVAARTAAVAAYWHSVAAVPDRGWDRRRRM